MWEAMHGSMGGYYEIRVTGPGRRQYRLFCRLENGTPDELAQRGFAEPQIVVINGMDKPSGRLFSDGDYRRHVCKLAGDFLSTLPRRIAV